MSVEAIVIQYLREGLGAEDIEVRTNGEVSAARARRVIATLRRVGQLPVLYRKWIREAKRWPIA